MANPIRAVIIDNDPEACNCLKHILTRFVNIPVTICGTARNITQGHLLVEHYQPDVVFMDVEMPDENGFAYLQRIVTFSFEVIFVTACDAYAVKAFKLNAIDYILKPIDVGDLERAIKKAAEKIAYKYFIKNKDGIRTNAVHQEYINNAVVKERILARNGNDIEVVSIKDILYIEANWSYSDIFFFKNNQLKKQTMSYPLATYEQMLAPQSFFRIHKSYLVNTAHIKKLTKESHPVLVLTNDIALPVGRRRYAELMSFLKK